MTNPILTLTLASGQSLNVTLSDPAQVEVLALAARGYNEAKAEQEVLGRIYHMGAKPTPGLDYDDRLTARLKCSADLAYSYLSTPVAKGGLAHRRLGNSYRIMERAIIEFFGFNPKAEKRAA